MSVTEQLAQFAIESGPSILTGEVAAEMKGTGVQWHYLKLPSPASISIYTSFCCR